MSDKSFKPKVLLVEDDAAYRELLAERFRSSGYPITTACEAQEALRAAKAGPYDIIVSDIHLPGLSGLDLLRSLGKQFPFVLVSGAITPATRAKALGMGAAAVLPKPVRWTDLRQAVENALRPRTPHPRALVADDHAATRTLLKHVLTQEGYEVDMASDGQEAVEKALGASEPYDLLITDILMPKLNGPDVIRKIRQIHKSTRIVFTTGGGSREEIRDCYQGGGASLWRKPFDMKGLVSELRRLKAAPARTPADDDTSVVSVWFQGLWEEVQKDKRKKMALRKAGMLVLAGFLFATLVGSFLHFQGVLGGVAGRMGDFMERVEGYLERDEEREMDINDRMPR